MAFSPCLTSVNPNLTMYGWLEAAAQIGICLFRRHRHTLPPSSLFCLPKLDQTCWMTAQQLMHSVPHYDFHDSKGLCPELIGSLMLGNVWVFVQPIFCPCWPMNQLNKTQWLPNLRLPISSDDASLNVMMTIMMTKWWWWCPLTVTVSQICVQRSVHIYTMAPCKPRRHGRGGGLASVDVINWVDKLGRDPLHSGGRDRCGWIKMDWRGFWIGVFHR